MSEKHPKQSLSEILDSIVETRPDTFQDLALALQHHAIAVVLILFAIPAALPVPAAGYSTVLSIPLMCIGVRILLGYDAIWLPKKIQEKPFNTDSFKSLIEKAQPFISFVEKFSKPRLSGIVNHKSTRTFIGLLICILALSMALPIPGTNTLPAGGIFLIGFSLLEDDGLLMLLGFVYSLAALAVSTLIIIFGYEVVKAGINAAKDAAQSFL